MKLDTLIDGHQRKSRVQAKVPERPSVRPSLSLDLFPLLLLWMHALFFVMIFTFFVENHLLGNTKLSFLVLWFKSYWPCKEMTLHFTLFLHSLLKITFELGNTKLSSLVLWFKNYRPCRQRALYFSLFFGLFVQHHLLENTKLSFLVSWFKIYWPYRHMALHFSLILDSFLTKNVSKVRDAPALT